MMYSILIQSYTPSYQSEIRLFWQVSGSQVDFEKNFATASTVININSLWSESEFYYDKAFMPFRYQPRFVKKISKRHQFAFDWFQKQKFRKSFEKMQNLAPSGFPKQLFHSMFTGKFN